MATKDLLKQLGYSETDRLVILHTDDIGMCQATLTAFADLWNFGTATSGAVMTPCAWFPAVAAFCRENPDVDMGVHATLNCEYSAYRWGAVSTTDPNSGLLDDDGYLHNRSETTADLAKPEAVAGELAAQIKKAVQGGIRITHVDSHMGTIFHPKFIQTYLGQSIGAGVPAMQPRVNAIGVEAMGASEEELVLLGPLTTQLEAQGMPLVDAIIMMPLHQPEGQLEIAKQLLSQVPVGITHFIYHPAVDTPELRAICPDWPSRVANYETFMDPAIKQFVQAEGIHLIGYRALRDLMHQGN